ncbi:MAG: hypothetical protein K0A99_05255 [Desulfoarculaceae bacterium]|nr:hypothetical protein [Desulfoarculaceae bacterium]
MIYFVRPINYAQVQTLIYHLPDGPALSLDIGGIGEFLDLEMNMGHVCDTSDIDGVLHFFPKGNA